MKQVLQIPEIGHGLLRFLKGYDIQGDVMQRRLLCEDLVKRFYEWRHLMESVVEYLCGMSGKQLYITKNAMTEFVAILEQYR